MVTRFAAAQAVRGRHGLGTFRRRARCGERLPRRLARRRSGTQYDQCYKNLEAGIQRVGTEWRVKREQEELAAKGKKTKR